MCYHRDFVVLAIIEAILVPMPLFGQHVDMPLSGFRCLCRY